MCGCGSVQVQRIYASARINRIRTMPIFEAGILLAARGGSECERRTTFCCITGHVSDVTVKNGGLLEPSSVGKREMLVKT